MGGFFLDNEVFYYIPVYVPYLRNLFTPYYMYLKFPSLFER